MCMVHSHSLPSIMNKFCNEFFVYVFWSSLNVRMGLSGEVIVKLNFHMGKSVVFFSYFTHRYTLLIEFLPINVRSYIILCLAVSIFQLSLIIAFDNDDDLKPSKCQVSFIWLWNTIYPVVVGCYLHLQLLVSWHDCVISVMSGTQ